MLNNSPEPSVSVIIPVYNGGKKFRRCLVSVIASNPSPREIIVVADGDTDGSWELAESLGVEVLRLQSPGGPARARNLGAAKARGEILLFIDADVTISKETLEKVLAMFNREADLAALFGSYDDEPAEPNFLSQYRNLLHHYVHQQGLDEASTFWAGCGAIRRDVFLANGGFNEQFIRPSVEDIELGYRLRKAGHRIRLCKSLQVKHLKRWDIGSMVKADFFHRALPWTDIILRERNCINDLNVGVSARVSVMLVHLVLGALFVSLWSMKALFAAGFMALMLLIINSRLYSFFLRKRGMWFALQSIPFHWLYFLYSGVAFGAGTVRHFMIHDPPRNVFRL